MEKYADTIPPLAEVHFTDHPYAPDPDLNSVGLLPTQASQDNPSTPPLIPPLLSRGGAWGGPKSLNKVEALEGTQQLSKGGVGDGAFLPSRGGVLSGYTYKIPQHLNLAETGVRVRVPFGHRQRVGIVTRIYHDIPDERTREILSVIDLVPVFSEELLNLTRWISEYYLCELGEVLAAAIPGGLKPRKTARYQLSAAGRAEPWIGEEESQTADLWRLLNHKALTQHFITTKFDNGATLFSRFKSRGWLEAVETESRSKLIAYEKVWKWTDAISYTQALSSLPKNASKITHAINILQQNTGYLTQSQLSSIQSGLNPIFRSLTKRGWATEDNIPRDRRSTLQHGMTLSSATSEVMLTGSQQEAINKISESLKSNSFKGFLLHGVTGSGKTIVYLEAVEQALNMGKGVIVMTPEISLTPQLTGRFHSRFGDRVVVTHSAMSAGERADVWRMVKSGSIKVVVGPRSAVFAPVANLGLVIIDEEHDDSYKQHDPAPRYNGRDVAVYRAMMNDAVALLGSATPSVTSYYNALQGRWVLVDMPERFGGVELPPIWIVKWGIADQGLSISPMLLKRLQDKLEKREQTILLVNRRAFSSIIRCPDCGTVATCPNCDITLRYHKVGQKLVCHYCGYTEGVYDICPNCKANRLRFSGLGTQRVEKELETVLPDAKIVRMDLDTTRTLGAHHDILTGFGAGKYDILLGTQMVAKGHDFPGVTLVGILAADYELFQPDFRAEERAFRLMVQAAGRAGRTGKGEVIIQSWDPTHRLYRLVQAHDYHALYASEIDERKALKYPPFSRIVHIVVKSEDRIQADTAAIELCNTFRAHLVDEYIMGPATPPIERLERFYRRLIMIKFQPVQSVKVKTSKNLLKFIMRQFEKRYKEIRFIVDVDALDV